MQFLEKIKAFEEKYKAKVNYISSLLLSLGIHAALITIFLIITMIQIEKKQPIPKMESKVKVSLASYKKEKKEIFIKSKKKIKKQIHKKKKVKDYDFEKNDNNSTIGEITSINKKTEYPNKGIEISYGPTFFMLSEEEQEYIVSQWARNNKINETIALFDRSDDFNITEKRKLKETDNNVISFYLYPDGNISDIEFLNKRKDHAFDKMVRRTIEKSAKYYKKPEKKILMKIFVGLEEKE